MTDNFVFGRIQLVCCTDTLLSEIGMKEAKRKDIAQTYALAILSDEEKDWKAINTAIMARWSRSGLEFIKKQADKEVREWCAVSHLPPAGYPHAD
jgi:hypothetical protein